MSLHYKKYRIWVRLQWKFMSLHYKKYRIWVHAFFPSSPVRTKVENTGFGWEAFSGQDSSMAPIGNPNIATESSGNGKSGQSHRGYLPSTTFKYENMRTLCVQKHYTYEMKKIKVKDIYTKICQSLRRSGNRTAVFETKSALKKFFFELSHVYETKL